MTKFLCISLVLLTSWITGSCSHNTRKVRILHKRANYEAPKQLSKDHLKMVRTEEQTKRAWLHPHEMPSGDYFAGAWIYLVVKKTEWAYPKQLKPKWRKN